MIGMTKASMPEHQVVGGDQGMGCRKLKRIQRPGDIAHDGHIPRLKILHKATRKGSNSTAQLLSMVNLRTKIRFLIS